MSISMTVAQPNARENFRACPGARMMLILMLMYQPRETEAVLRDRRRAAQIHAEGRRARMLRGRTVGLVGLGRIARGVRRAAFGIRREPRRLRIPSSGGTRRRRASE